MNYEPKSITTVIKQLDGHPNRQPL